MLGISLRAFAVGLLRTRLLQVSSASDCPPNWSIIQRLQEPVLASSSNAKGYETNPQHSSLDEEGAGATLQQAADQIESVGSEDCTDALTVQREPQVVSSEDALACLPSTLVSDREATSHSPAVPSSCAPVRCIRQPQQKVWHSVPPSVYLCFCKVLSDFVSLHHSCFHKLYEFRYISTDSIWSGRKIQILMLL